MRFFHVAVLALTALLAPVSVSAGMIDASNAADEFLRQGEWKDFKAKFDKVYESEAEEELRFQNFKENMARNVELSKLNPEATYGVTRFSDLSRAEFKKYYLGYRPDVDAARERHSSYSVKKCEEGAVAGDVDWRTSGAVTAVKDQGQCGSCWAFSAVEGVESAWFLKHNQTVTLSPQQVVDCDTTDQGCNGGDLPPAFAYIKANGLEAESSYQYTGKDGTCKYSSGKVVAKITGFTYATTPCTGACTNQDEATLLKNLGATGPSSICVDATNWDGYTSGIYKAACSKAYGQLNHCVQLVGYSSSGATPYWIVRNSWGTSWGQKGYIYLAYGTNECGVADEATFATSG